MVKSKCDVCKWVTIVLVTILLIILIVYACKGSEPFTNMVEWAKKLGYPRPQGNLSNYKYGTKKKATEAERKSWDNVLKKRQMFKIPQSKTVLV